MSVDGAWRRQVSDLIAAVQQSDLNFFELEHGAFAVRIEREIPLVAPVAPAAPTLAEPDVQPQEEQGPKVLRSPQVGTFYLSAEPNGEPFVREGSVVEPGQVVGLIEAMKLISEVEAEVGGTVRRVLVQDGQPVEYGQPLFELD